jgi:arginyl-tRNA synthetase
MITLYNSLSRKREEFVPADGKTVKLYTCGVTVYDYAHIGNFRTYITWDVLKRILKYQGYEVNHVMNITDVGHLTSDADSGEDRMEVAKKRERKTAWDVAKFYTDIYHRDFQELNILPPTHEAALLKEQQEKERLLIEKKQADEAREKAERDALEARALAEKAAQEAEARTLAKEAELAHERELLQQKAMEKPAISVEEDTSPNTVEQKQTTTSQKREVPEDILKRILE